MKVTTTLNRTALNAAEFVRHLVEKVRMYEITKEQAILQLDEQTIERLTKPTFAVPILNKIIASGVPICSGVAAGKVYFSIQKGAKALKAGEPIILFKDTITAEDINSFGYVQGVLSFNEDPTSHTAIIARAMGRPFISKLSQGFWEPARDSIHVGGEEIKEGEWLSMDAFDGILIRGKVRIQKPSTPEEYYALLDWIDQTTRISVHGNADTPEEAVLAIENGAWGIESRTEYMFFKPERLNLFRQMILAKSGVQQELTLSKLLLLQRAMFIKLYEVMGDRPVVIRLLDPPLHEFLPETEDIKRELAQDLDVDLTWIENRLAALREVNPMMGNRGVRLLITHPAIAAMQVRALFEAALEMARRGKEVIPRILIPMVVCHGELIFLKKVIKGIHQEVCTNESYDVQYYVGAMIETPRAALTAAQIGKEVDFISFGTNDLTAQVFGFSRGDVLGKFLSKYLEERILDSDPFYCLDKGVAVLVKEALSAARGANPRIHASLCGEQGGEKSTIEFCNQIGLDSISCSPPRIPVVKLLAAQAAIRQLMKNDS